MKLLFISSDADGCLINPQMLHPINKDIAAANPEFTDFFETKIKSGDYQEATGYIGSNRQSFPSEHLSAVMNRNGYFFPRIKTLYEKMGIQFDPILLADIENDLNDGEAYAKAIELLKDLNQSEMEKQLDFNADLHKINILYAQMHRAASLAVENYGNIQEDIEIEFHFVDDRPDILDGLAAFFGETTHLDWMPKEVTLYLHKYKGSSFENKPTILQGKGLIDNDYKKTVKKMGELAPLDSKEKARNIAAMDLNLLNRFSSEAINIEAANDSQSSFSNSVDFEDLTSKLQDFSYKQNETIDSTSSSTGSSTDEVIDLFEKPLSSSTEAEAKALLIKLTSSSSSSTEDVMNQELLENPPSYNLQLMIAGGLSLAVGIAGLVLLFLIFNPVTLGAGGVVALGLTGGAFCLAGLGLFSKGMLEGCSDSGVEDYNLSMDRAIHGRVIL